MDMVVTSMEQVSSMASKLMVVRHMDPDKLLSHQQVLEVQVLLYQQLLKGCHSRRLQDNHEIHMHLEEMYWEDSQLLADQQSHKRNPQGATGQDGIGILHSGNESHPDGTTSGMIDVKVMHPDKEMKEPPALIVTTEIGQGREIHLRIEGM